MRAYQVVLSPLMGGCCRFVPSCSEYMILALQVHGPVKGALLGTWRLLRCHPFGKSGFDPVPPRGSWKVGKLGSREVEKLGSREVEKLGSREQEFEEQLT